ncbi:SDR family NAD(P)-dependent oxidoreductase [Luethyella okanaganae]|uniref:SDR family NAD(P)-dependent oxidoreductase n=1 Tax=Luethyella okanaganae TaxID=69372 RepID=A0ABW1VEX6_9MICO
MASMASRDAGRATLGWDPAILPSQAGKVFVVTGGNAGLGYFTSEQLASAGAHVVLACRNPQRSDAAANALRGRVPGASVSVISLDVADLHSVRAASSALLELDRIDGLVLNAGIVHPPRDRQVSLDGHELVFATNYLGHFALVARMLPALVRTRGSRVVALGSMISRVMDSALDDPQLERSYQRWRAYAQSKIAMQVFGFELDRRLHAANLPVSGLVAHPGYSVSGLSPRIAGVNDPSRLDRLVDKLQGCTAQSKEAGAWPIVRAAIDPDAVGGQYWGPRLLTKGRPVLQTPTRTSRDAAIAARLWQRSEEYSGIEFVM